MKMNEGLRTETRDIEGIEITTTQLPPLRALALMPRLGKVIAPMLALDGVSMDSDVRELVPALVQMLDTLSGDEATALTRALLASTTALLDGKMVQLNRDETLTMVFAGRLKAMVLAVAFAVGVNYGEFFAKGPAASPATSPQMASP